MSLDVRALLGREAESCFLCEHASTPVECMSEQCVRYSLAEVAAIRQEIERLTNERLDSAQVCGGCDGPYTFDTSVPSVLWNRVVRAKGGSEYLCARCVLKAFAEAGVSFTAELTGDGFHGLPIAVEINGQVSTAPLELNDENNRLRCEKREAEASLAALQAEHQKVLEQIRGHKDWLVAMVEQAKQVNAVATNSYQHALVNLSEACLALRRTQETT